MKLFKTIILILLLVIILLTTINCKPEPVLNPYETELLDLLNGERAASNLNALVPDRYLMDVAARRSNEILNGVFMHKPLHDTIENRTGHKIKVGEILGKSIITTQPEDFISAWLNSKTHKDVILNPKYGFTKIGIGIADNGKVKVITILFSSD